MKKMNKASKFFVLISVILAFTVIFSVTTVFAAEENLMKSFASDTTEAFYEYRWNIETVTFVDSLDGSDGDDVFETWDISANDDESVKAWLKTSIINSQELEEGEKEEVPPHELRYDLYIGADGKIKASEDMSYFFYDFSNLLAVSGLENLDTSSTKNMASMFSSCESIEVLDLGELDTSSVKDMTSMFYGCTSLQDLNLVGFNTESLELTVYMFYDCKSLKELNLKSFNVRNVKDSQYMFYNCEDLKTIYVGDNWLFLSVVSSDNMFKNCYFLVGKTKYDSRKVDARYATTSEYTVHASVLENEIINLVFRDTLNYGESKRVVDYTGYYYLSFIEEVISHNTDVIVVTSDGELVAVGPGRAEIVTNLKTEGNISFQITVVGDEVVVKPPNTMLSQMLQQIIAWFNKLFDIFFGWMKA